MIASEFNSTSNPTGGIYYGSILIFVQKAHVEPLGIEVLRFLSLVVVHIILCLEEITDASKENLTSEKRLVIEHAYTIACN